MHRGLQRSVLFEQGAYQSWLGCCCFMRQGRASDKSHRILWCEMSSQAEAAQCFC